jgi:methionyl-tRNA synthetase
VEVPYFLSKYDPDALRFYLTATAPETRDTEFSWEDFVERNNPVLPAPVGAAQVSADEGNELVATWANLCQRPRKALGFMLSFACKRFDGVVPEPGDPSGTSGQGLDEEDRALLEKVEAGFETVGALYAACKFRAAPSALLRAGLGEAAVAKQLPS